MCIRDSLKSVPTNDPEMAAASAKARSGLDEFLRMLDNPPDGTTDYSVKIGIVDQGDGFALTGLTSVENVEYFWIGNLERATSGFVGTISNDPGVVRNVRAGQRIVFGRSDVFDWMYIDNGKIVGNVTACPILLRGPKEELEYYRQNYGLDC